jgi:hypothetical protein
MTSRATTGTALLLLASWSLSIPTASARDSVTASSSYETATQSHEQPLQFDPSTGTFRAGAAADAFGPAGPAGPGATRGSTLAVWSGGPRATGRISSRVESRDADNYPDVPFNDRQVSSTIDSEFVAQYIVADSTPGDATVPVTFDLRFTGRFFASGDAADPNPWPAMIKVEGRGWARANRGSLPMADPFEGDALLDAYNGVDDGGDFDGLLDEAAGSDDPRGGFLLHAGRTYAGSVTPATRSSSSSTAALNVPFAVDDCVNDQQRRVEWLTVIDEGGGEPVGAFQRRDAGELALLTSPARVSLAPPTALVCRQAAHVVSCSGNAKRRRMK